jgi:hypothetical protein
MACLLQNEPASYVDRQVKRLRREAEAKASLNRASGSDPMSVGVDPKPGDLAMARSKLG